MYGSAYVSTVELKKIPSALRNELERNLLINRRGTCEDGSASEMDCSNNILTVYAHSSEISVNSLYTRRTSLNLKLNRVLGCHLLVTSSEAC